MEFLDMAGSLGLGEKERGCKLNILDLIEHQLFEQPGMIAIKRRDKAESDYVRPAKKGNY